MVIWINQEEPGTGTPSSTEDEQEDMARETPTKVRKINICCQTQNIEYYSYNKGNTRCHQNFPGWYATKENDENFWGQKEDVSEDFKVRTLPSAPVAGVGVPKIKLNRYESQIQGRRSSHPSRTPYHLAIDRNRGADTGDCFNYSTNSEYSSSLAKGNIRDSSWAYPDSVFEEVESNVFSPTPTQELSKSNLESFFSLLPWEEFLTPEKPKYRPSEPITELSFACPELTPGISRGHPASPLLLTQGDIDKWSQWLDEPEVSHCAMLSLYDFFFSKEQHSVDVLSKQMMTEYKSNTQERNGIIALRFQDDVNGCDFTSGINP